MLIGFEMKFDIISKPIARLGQSPLLVGSSILENIYGGGVLESPSLPT